jgi:hypothetical protein
MLFRMNAPKLPKLFQAASLKFRSIYLTLKGEYHLITEDMAPQEPTTVADEVQNVSPYTQALAKRVLRKIDTRILAIMFVTYNLNFMDKTILSSAAVFGLKEDNNLVGQQYSWCGSMFYFGYMFFEYPATLLIQKLPIGKYLAGVCLLWGAIVAATAGCSNFGGVATVRFFLGVAVCASG